MNSQQEPNPARTEVERALKAMPEAHQQGLGPPMTAMAEALRANAEALRVLDANQRQLAETIAKSEKASNVVASTRALNETFRGLSEIQRGLLDAIVKNRGGGVVVLIGFLLVAAVAGVAGVYLFDRLDGEEKVPRALYEEAQRSAGQQAEQIADLRERLRSAEASTVERDRRLNGKEREVEDLARGKADLAKRVESLESELDSNRAQLGNFLQVKQQADLAGQLQVRNLQLEQDNRRMREKLDGLEGSRAELLNNFGDVLLEMRGGDKEAILALARKMGVFKEPPPAPEPGGPAPLNRRGEKLVKDYLNRLFPDDGNAIMLLGVKGIAEGSTLRDVTLAEYQRGTMVKSFECKELTIRVDMDRDTVELRLVGGYIVNTRRPRERIPFSEDGHSIFLSDVDLRSWLRRVGPYISVGDQGILTWKSTPS